ncbi:MAG: 5-(carboxyamino)imidazole ribonucleotide mutase [Gammaproteobacteria bacterium]|nr:5-(carboxyamino)imidazole ribonucleotide mutase [Gammaproteobacteria bacterium]MCH9744446.1 5-(carboxyamino)imidazole ribonucleotide mutase [Gammaproteobacteria bacterium]
MNNPFVAILMGSDSDLPVMQHCMDTLKELGVRFEANILSAHRTPDKTAAYVKDADQRGCHVFIAAAGLAAHLAGAVAANTIRPVVGIPLDAGSLKGMDALLATVQMPGGTPVACTSIGKAGAKNAAFLAAQILALHDDGLSAKLTATRDKKRQSLQQANEKLQSQL